YIARLYDWPRVVHHVPKTTVHESQQDDVAGLQAFCQFIAMLTIQNTMSLLFLCKQEWQVVQLECRLNLCNDGIGNDATVNGTKTHAFEHLPFIPQLAVGIHLHGDLTIADSLYRFLESACAHSIRIFFAISGGPTYFQRGGRLSDTGYCNAEHRRNGYDNRGKVTLHYE